jgi:alkylhydroperoxidase family enzyme
MAGHIAPIEKPEGLLMRIAYAMSNRQFGKVLSVLKVIYARKPDLALLAQKIVKTQDRLSIPSELRALIQVNAARLNGCRFCEDVQLAIAYQKQIGRERFIELAEHRSSSLFNAKEKAALAFAEEATLHRKVSENTWALVKREFSDTQIVELAWLNASENYFNLQAAVLGLDSDGVSTAALQRDVS